MIILCGEERREEKGKKEEEEIADKSHQLKN
jgi:hypothetical protein